MADAARVAEAAVRRRAISPLHLWIGICAAAIAGGVASRALHFVDGLPAPLDALLGRLLALEFVAFLTGLSAAPMLLALLLACLLLLLLRRRWCLERTGARWRLRPWLAAVAWAALLPASFLLDLGRDLATLYAVTLPLAAAPFALPALRGRVGGVALLALWGTTVAVWAARLPTPLAIPSGIAWALLAAPLSLAGARWATARDALALLLACGAFLQLSVVLPGATPPDPAAHGGNLLGEGRVYSFCELPGRGTLLGVVNSCEGSDIEACRDDHLVAYERDALAAGPRILSLFDDAFYGRMLHLLCLEDQVRVAMSFTRIDGTLRTENVMAFDPEHPEARRRSLPNPGHRLLYDPDADVVYTVSEYSDLVAFDSRGGGPDARGRFRIDPAAARGGGWIRSLQTEIGALSQRRGSLFFVEWIGGRRLFEVERDTHATRRAYSIWNGGSHSLAVDDELERVIVSGLWGVEAIDLRSGRSLARWRTDFGPRLPVIDAARDRIYVTTTFGPSIWVFERRSFRPIGRLPIGVGARNAYLTRDGALFLASNDRRHYWWDAEALAERFGR